MKIFREFVYLVLMFPFALPACRGSHTKKKDEASSPVPEERPMILTPGVSGSSPLAQSTICKDLENKGIVTPVGADEKNLVKISISKDADLKFEIECPGMIHIE